MTRDIDQVMLDRRDVMKGTAAAAGALLLPGGAIAQGTPRKGGTLRVAMPYNPGAVDPMTGRNLPDFDVLYAVFDALIDFEPLDARAQARPRQVLEVHRPQDAGARPGRRRQIPRRHAVQCRGGQVQSRALQERPALEREGRPRHASTRSRSRGKSQVTIKLNKPERRPADHPDQSRRADRVAEVDPRRNGGNVDRNPVGTGPFKFVSWQDNDSFVLVRNENYWKPGLPYLDGINIKIINELNTVVRAVVAGEADRGHQPAGAAEGGRRSLAQRGREAHSVARALRRVPQLRTPAARRRSHPPGAQLRDQPRRDQQDRRGRPRPAVERDPAEGALGLRSRDAEFLHTTIPTRRRSCWPKPAIRTVSRSRPIGWADQLAMQRQEVIISQLAKVGIRIKLTALAPQQAVQAFMIEKKGAMFISPSSAVSRSESVLRGAVRQDALRNAGGVELPGFRELLDATMEAQDQATRKAAFVKLQRFVVEQAMQMVQYISPAVSVAESRRCRTSTTACWRCRSSPRSGCRLGEGYGQP